MDSDLVSNSIKTFNELIEHIDTIVVDNTKSYICKHCKAHFKRKEQITNHLNKLKKCYTTTFSFHCDKCKKGFNVFRDYQNHINRINSCVKNFEFDNKINQTIQLKVDEESFENKFNLINIENQHLKSQITSLNNQISSLNSKHENFIKYINLFFTEFYEHPTNPSKLFPQPYFAMITLINKINKNILYYDYLYFIISHLNTDKEFEHFIFPLVLHDFYELHIAIDIINTLVTIYNNLANNRIHKLNDKTSYSLQIRIKHIVGMIYFWINKYKLNDDTINILKDHFIIPQHFYTYFTDINLDFDFNSLL